MAFFSFLFSFCLFSPFEIDIHLAEEKIFYPYCGIIITDCPFVIEINQIVLCGADYMVPHQAA